MSFAEDGELSGATATATPPAEAQVDSGEGLGEGAAPPDPTAVAPPEGEAAPAEEGQPPAPLPEGWQDHPDTQAHVNAQFEERYNERFNTDRSERDKQHQQEKDRREERYNTEVSDAYEQGQAVGVVTGLKEIAEEGGLDTSGPDGQREFYKLLGKHAAWAPVVARMLDIGNDTSFAKHMNDTYREAGLSKEVVAELDTFHGELAWRVRHKQTVLRDASRELHIESLKRARADGEQVGAQNEKERRDKLDREMTDAAGRVTKRGKQPPPTAPGGSGAGGSGSGGYRTKAEARALHVQNKISNAEMRRINADPAIPEM